MNRKNEKMIFYVANMERIKVVLSFSNLEKYLRVFEKMKLFH